MKKTLVDLFEASVSKYPNNTFLLEKTGKQFEPTTYAQVKEQVYRLGAGLQALGVKKGDTMALLSEGRNMWVIGELAMFYAGAVNVPLSVKLEESNDLLFRLIHGDVKFIMVSGTQLRKIRTIKESQAEKEATRRARSEFDSFRSEVADAEKSAESSERQAAIEREMARVAERQRRRAERKMQQGEKITSMISLEEFSAYGVDNLFHVRYAGRCCVLSKFMQR